MSQGQQEGNPIGIADQGQNEVAQSSSSENNGDNNGGEVHNPAQQQPQSSSDNAVNSSSQNVLLGYMRRECEDSYDSSSSDDDMAAHFLGMDRHLPINLDFVVVDSDSDHDSEYFSKTNSDDSYTTGTGQSTQSVNGTKVEQRCGNGSCTLNTPATSSANNDHSIGELKAASTSESKSTSEVAVRPRHLQNCEVCSKPADFVCRGCYRSAYCSKNHQMEKWKKHRRDCVHFGLTRSSLLLYRGPFSVESDNKTGGRPTYRLESKILTTTKQQILEEKPFLICPWPRLKLRQSEKTLAPGLVVRNLSCFGCGKTLCFSWVRCEDCNLFLCSKECLYMSNHKKCECKVIKQLALSSKSIKLDPRLDLKGISENEDYREFLYMDVMIIRLILKLDEMRNSMNPEQFVDEWRKLDLIWKTSSFPPDRENERRRNLFDKIQIYLRFSYTLLGSNKTNLLWKLFSIIDMNSFPFELPFRRFRTLCVVLGLAKHSCVPNCHVYLHEAGMDKISMNQIEQDPNELTVVVTSGRNLVVGTTLNFSYVPLIFGTMERRAILQEIHCIWCVCPRCVDPAECGTFATNIRCPTCKTAMVIPPNPVPIPGSQGKTVLKPDWVCRGQITRSSSAFRRPSLNRFCPAVKHDEAMAKLRAIEVALSKYSTENLSAVRDLMMTTQNGNSFFYLSVLLKLCEDIIRGTFYPLPDILADDLEEYKDQILLGIILAKKTYKEFMNKVNPGFDFEGFPVGNMELAENELLGRETGKIMLLSAVGHLGVGTSASSHSNPTPRPIIRTSSVTSLALIN